ncbi:MAG: ABC transporter substrate-binding protein [Desulfobacterales bacterium]|jgi:NitT/TauT family transport system substrate-binding protein|nr:ABC transporter substrate-binding protein [Desulfobacterales bacterium]
MSVHPGSNLKHAAAIFLMAGFLFACGTNEKLEEVNYRLKWLYNVSTVGDLYADARGHFERNGLKVHVKPGGPERDALKELELGHAQFGVASADQVFRAVAKGAPIVVLAQLFQVNPLNWIYRPGRTPFSSPDDWKGRTIGVTFGGNDETILRALLARYRIAEAEVDLFSVRYDYTPFYEGRVAFWPIYLNAQAVIIGDKLSRAGESFGFVSPDRLGVKFVANSVVATRQMVERHPETVKRFLAALLQGWREALDPQNEEQAVRLLAQVDRETPEAVVRRQLAVTRELMLPAAGVAFGKIDLDAWRQTAEIMAAQRLIPAGLPVEAMLVTGPKPMP